jgi:signal transduction histidine kinase
MIDIAKEPVLPADNILVYMADLELEVDRLRRQGRFLEKRTAETLSRIIQLCGESAALGPQGPIAEVGSVARQLLEVVKDMHATFGYHPTHDQVVPIAVRPLIEQVFRWQQRLTGSPHVALRLQLEIDHAEWFPARFRHLVDNLTSNAMRYRDPKAAESWVAVGFRAANGGYELRVSDNGLGPPPGEDRRSLELFFRSTPARSAGFDGCLAVVKLLVEQSGGAMQACPRENGGTDFILTLPRYDLLDYLE